MVKVGSLVKIISMKGEPQYSGKVGVVRHIDDIGQLHGSWGGCAIQPENDEFEVIEPPMSSAEYHYQEDIC
jgi:hypothetical protein